DHPAQAGPLGPERRAPVELAGLLDGVHRPGADRAEVETVLPGASGDEPATDVGPVRLADRLQLTRLGQVVRPRQAPVLPAGGDSCLSRCLKHSVSGYG